MSLEQLNSMLIQQLSSMTPTYLFWTMVFSFIGIGYLAYGKKRSNYVLLISGLTLMIYPYFVSSTYLIVLFGLVFTIAPYIWLEWFD